MLAHLKRRLVGWRNRARGFAADTGLLPYVMPWPVSVDEWNESYASGSLSYYEDPAQRVRLFAVASQIDLHPAKQPRVLDIGCGNGFLRTLIPDDRIGEYVGLDVAQVPLDEAKARGIPRTRFVVGERPTPDLGQFDVISLTDMTCYVEDLPGLLEHLRAYLKPGGWLLHLLYDHPGCKALNRTVARHYDEQFAASIVNEGKPHRAWRLARYTPRHQSAPVASLQSRRAA